MIRSTLAVAAAAFLAVPLASAQSTAFQRDCAQWIEKHGYSADYIKLRTGKRQRGTPDGWRSNIAVKDVQAGDVVITAIKDKPPHLRVSFVEACSPLRLHSGCPP